MQLRIFTEPQQGAGYATLLRGSQRAAARAGDRQAPGQQPAIHDRVREQGRPAALADLACVIGACMTWTAESALKIVRGKGRGQRPDQPIWRSPSGHRSRAKGEQNQADIVCQALGCANYEARWENRVSSRRI
jgi:hypothetical protein